MKRLQQVILQFSLLVLIVSCSDQTEENNREVLKSDIEVKQFNKVSNRIVENEIKKSYDVSSFSGTAEICTYKLDKARYDNVHPGEAVLVFVSEPFLPNEQVKADNWKKTTTVPVLKMNRIDRFTTGIYDYSMFTSVFTPVANYDPKYPLKITFSSQDWCGQSFMQLNNNEGFDIQQFSYFESEGDTSFHENYTLTEDNLFNLARIDTNLLPKGEFEIIPSLHYIRSSHEEYKRYTANGSLGNKDGLKVYNCEIPALKKSMRIFLDPQEKNRIVKWSETYPTVFDGKLRTSTYELKAVKSKPYWSMNSKEDQHWRDTLNM